MNRRSSAACAAAPKAAAARASAAPAALRSVLLLFVVSTAGAFAAQPPPAPAQRGLQAPLKMAISGQSLREALDSMQQASGQAYWLERRVDPNQLVAVPLAGPTVADAFEQVAASAGLVTLHCDGIVVIGRAGWIDRVGALLMQRSDSLDIPSPDIIPSAGETAGPSVIAAQPRAVAPSLNTPQQLDWPTRDAPAAPRPAALDRPIEWPMLTTPNDALRIAGERAGLSAASISLPHDLWPAARLPAHSQATVIALIGAEFDLALVAEPLRRQLHAQPLPEQTAVVEGYPAARLTPQVRQEISAIDPAADWTPTGNAVQLRANARAHQWLAQRIAGAAAQPAAAAKPGGAKPGGAGERFTVRLQNAPAGEVLAMLAAAGHWTLQVDPAAAERCQTLVNLEAVDVPLIDLVDRVVEQAGLTAGAQGAVLRIGLP